MTTIRGTLLGVSFTLGDNANLLTFAVLLDGDTEGQDFPADPAGRYVVDGVDREWPEVANLIAALTALPPGSRAVLHADPMRYGTVTAGEFYPPGAPA